MEGTIQEQSDRFIALSTSDYRESVGAQSWPGGLLECSPRRVRLIRDEELSARAPGYDIYRICIGGKEQPDIAVPTEGETR